ncbi:MAG: MMPL family transporter [Actinobacteria bacterium]|nr:MMPL family transporter [Actinomycetota bacterium]
MTTLSTERIARACARHPWRTIGTWVVALVLAIGTIVALLDLTSEGEITSDPESERGYDLIGRHFPPDPSAEFVNELVLVRSSSLTVDDPAFRAKVEMLLAEVRASGVVHNVESFYESGDAALVSRDRSATLLPIGLMGDCEESADTLIGIVEAGDGGDFDAKISGECSADRDLNQILNDDLKTGELYFGLPAALVILVLVFGALIAAVVPLVVAVLSIGIALGLSAIFSQAFDLSVFLFQMTTVMGLAIATDYGLFIVSRYRKERAAGRDKLDAIAGSGATASRAVLFSGLAFVLAMSGMLLVPDSVLRSLGVGALTVGLVSVFAALTLVPALLGLLGDRVDALRIPFLGRTVGSASREGRFWSRIARAVMRRPVVSLVVAIVVLLAAAAPILDLRLSAPGLRSFPDDAPSKQGFAALEEEFGVGTVDSVIIAVEGDVTTEPLRGAVRRFAERLETNPVFRNPEVEVSPDRQLALIEALVVGDSRDAHALTAVERLRSQEVSAVFGGMDAIVLVTGETAEEIDYTELMSTWLPRIIAFVLLLSFILLTIAFRSIVLPLKAIVLNLLSVGAAYGLMVLVFQKGIGNELFGLRETEVVTTWVPLFLFSVLFGLSMDYQVFLLSRIREHYLRTGDNEEAVAHGVSTTARVITGAALIIIAVFAGFASGNLAETQQVGFGVGVALLIDATIVRCVLVPASMKLLGEWNWYLPAWLGWLPDPHVEHEP